jgi:hypothetical protein
MPNSHFLTAIAAALLWTGVPAHAADLYGVSIGPGNYRTSLLYGDTLGVTSSEAFSITSSFENWFNSSGFNLGEDNNGVIGASDRQGYKKYSRIDTFGSSVWSAVGEIHAFATPTVGRPAGLTNPDPSPITTATGGLTGWRDTITFSSASSQKFTEVTFNFLVDGYVTNAAYTNIHLALYDSVAGQPEAGSVYFDTSALLDAYALGSNGSTNPRWFETRDNNSINTAFATCITGQSVSNSSCLDSYISGGQQNLIRISATVPTNTPLILYSQFEYDTRYTSMLGGTVSFANSAAITHINTAPGVALLSSAEASYIYSPVPEPESLSLFLLGAALITAIKAPRCKRRRCENSSRRASH